jgi:hypothetical protein
MFRLWTNLKVGVKLLSAFCVVIVLFLVAMVGIRIIDVKIAATQVFRTDRPVGDKPDIALLRESRPHRSVLCARA